MKISQAINATDKFKPNQYTVEQKVAWLSALDHKIYNELIKTHETAVPIEFQPYGVHDMDKELLVQEPYAADIYNYYLQSMMDRENGETAKLNDSARAYNNAYMEYAAWFNRTYKPLRSGGFIY